MTAPSRTYTCHASWIPTSRAFSASLAGFTVLGISNLAGAACVARGGSCSWLGNSREYPYVASATDTPASSFGVARRLKSTQGRCSSQSALLHLAHSATFSCQWKRSTLLLD